MLGRRKKRRPAPSCTLLFACHDDEFVVLDLARHWSCLRLITGIRGPCLGLGKSSRFREKAGFAVDIFAFRSCRSNTSPCIGCKCQGRCMTARPRTFGTTQRNTLNMHCCRWTDLSLESKLGSADMPSHRLALHRTWRAHRRHRSAPGWLRSSRWRIRRCLSKSHGNDRRCSGRSRRCGRPSPQGSGSIARSPCTTRQLPGMCHHRAR
jgi:hypothetical protein